MSREQKKFSLYFINNDARTHAAYKNIINSNDNQNNRMMGNNSSTNTQSAFQEFQKYQKMKYPFGLSETRFLWQNNNNKHKTAHSIELQGTLNKKINIQNSLEGGFESFYDQTQKLKCDKSIKKNQSMHFTTRRKIIENMNSSRVMDTNKDVN